MRRRKDGRFRLNEHQFPAKVVVPPELLAKELTKDSRLTKLQLLLDEPKNEQRARLKKMLRAKYAPALAQLRKKKDAIQEELIVAVDRVIKLDQEMHKLLWREDEMEWDCHHPVLHDANKIRKEIKARIRIAQRRLYRIIRGQQRSCLRQRHGFWDWLKTKRQSVYRDDPSFPGSGSIKGHLQPKLKEQGIFKPRKEGNP